MLSKIKLVALVLFLSTTALAAVFPTVPTLTIGGQVITGNSTADQQFTGSGSLITLTAATTGATNRYSGLIKIGATTAYTPSGSKKFVSTGVQLIAGSGSGLPFYFSSCDTALGTASTSAPVNPVYLGNGASGNINSELGLVTPGTLGSALSIPGPIVTIPNGKFGCADNGGTAGSGTAFIYGYEQ